MATLLTVPVASRVVGRLGPFSVAMPSAPAFWTILFTKGATWPAAGEVLRVTVEESQNGGGTWEFSAGTDFTGGLWRNRAGQTISTATWVTTPMYRGANCRIRVTIDVKQACHIGATVSA